MVIKTKMDPVAHIPKFWARSLNFEGMSICCMLNILFWKCRALNQNDLSSLFGPMHKSFQTLDDVFKEYFPTLVPELSSDSDSGDSADESSNN